MKKVLSILGGIICALVCLFLFAAQISFITFQSVKNVITKDSISKVVDNIDVKGIVSSDPETASNLYGLFDTLGFSVEETDHILESNAFKEFVNEYLYKNVENLLDDKDATISYDAFNKLVNDIETETNITFKNKEVFLKLLEEKFPEIEKSINFSNTVRKDVGEENLEVIRMLLGNTLTIVFEVLFIFVFLVMCLFRWSLYKPLIWYGITTTLSSFIMLQFFLAINAIKELVAEENKTFELIISPILDVIKSKGLIVSLIMLAVGILMIVAFALIHKNKKDKEEKEEFKMLDGNDQEETL